jgi:hypothetical protein
MGVGRSINYKSKRMNECPNTKIDHRKQGAKEEDG